MCQDAGTAITMGKKGRFIWTDGDDKAALAEGARDAHLKKNLRYSQLAPVSMFEEKNTRSNMPAKARTPTGCCSSPRAAVPPTNRSSSRRRRPFSPPDRLIAFLKENVLTLGTAACPITSLGCAVLEQMGLAPA